MNTTTWYSEGLRWMAEALTGAADFLDRRAPEPMPRHTSAEEVLSDLRNRANAFYTGSRPHYW